jgi:uncharacterized protein (TIGR02996 family)
MITHPDAKAFVSRILSDPADPVIRAVFADWLDEQGGTANENWSLYIRLRAEAAATHGSEREVLLEEAANVAPHLKARLIVPAGKFARHMPDFLDLLPPDRYTIQVGRTRFPKEPNEALGRENALAARSVVLADYDGLFGVITDTFLPGLSRVLGHRLNGRVLLFATPTADLEVALAGTFPPLPQVDEPTPHPDELTRRLARGTADRLVSEARDQGATLSEVMAQPSGFEVRLVVGGRPKRWGTLDPNVGKRVVDEFFAVDAYARLNVRTRPRNTSFGVGAEVQV